MWTCQNLANLAYFIEKLTFDMILVFEIHNWLCFTLDLPLKSSHFCTFRKLIFIVLLFVTERFLTARTLSYRQCCRLILVSSNINLNLKIMSKSSKLWLIFILNYTEFNTNQKFSKLQFWQIYVILLATLNFANGMTSTQFASKVIISGKHYFKQKVAFLQKSLI